MLRRLEQNTLNSLRDEVATEAEARLLVFGLGLRKCGRFHEPQLTHYDDWAQAAWLRCDTSQTGLPRLSVLGS